MRFPWIILILLLLLVGGWFLLGVDSDADRVADLKKRKMQGQQDEVDIESITKQNQYVEPDWETLEKEGKAPAVPDHLFVSPSKEQDSWLITTQDSELSVEIPFGAGKLRTPPLTDQIALNPNPGFLGSDACAECHQEKHDTFVHTAHHLTSRPADDTSFGGSFEEGRNVLRTGNQYVAFKMVRRNKRYFQRVYFFGWEFEVPMDIVIGSSKLGQSYLFWNGDELYQSSVSYLTGSKTWMNSPDTKTVTPSFRDRSRQGVSTVIFRTSIFAKSRTTSRTPPSSSAFLVNVVMARVNNMSNSIACARTKKSANTFRCRRN